MSLSLLTLMKLQKPTNDEKYILKQCIKILAFNRYSTNEIISSKEKRIHNEILENIIKGLKLILENKSEEHYMRRRNSCNAVYVRKEVSKNGNF